MKSNSHDIELQNLGSKSNSNGVRKVTFNENDDKKKILNSAPVITKDERKQLKKQSSSAATIEEDEEDGRRKSKFYNSKKVSTALYYFFTSFCMGTLNFGKAVDENELNRYNYKLMDILLFQIKIFWTIFGQQV